jgi:LmbE family N-acetylglucosaminyl deacetylase
MWIYLSPHFDDAAFSCGGLLWEQAHAGEGTALWTVCAGEIPPGSLSPFAQSLHARWTASELRVSPRQWSSPREGSSLQPAEELPSEDEDQAIVERRRAEDLAACIELSASYRHISIPDCIYRGASVDPGDPQSRVYFYASEQALFGSLNPAEAPLVESLARELRAAIPAGAQVVCPLGLGNHVDHQLTRRAAESLGLELWYYPDFPYTRQDVEELELLFQSGWQPVVFPVSPAGLEAWCRAVAAHRSQVSTFWPDLDAMWEELHAYCHANGGVVLWRRGS